MSSRWHEKKAKLAAEQFERELQGTKDSAMDPSKLASEVAMGGGEDQFYEKKMSKEEKKAAAKAKREAKKKAKKGGKGDAEEKEAQVDVAAALQAAKLSDQPTSMGDDGIDHEQSDQLASEGTICTYSASRKGVDARARDINVEHVTLQHMGAVLLDDAHIVLNHGNRYGLIGRNGCGKVCEYRF